jgi:hypothetical protein
VTESEKWQRARITRAAEMVAKCAHRGDYETAQMWVKRFGLEVNRLNRVLALQEAGSPVVEFRYRAKLARRAWNDQ